MIIRRRGKTIRSGIAKSRTIRNGKTESRNTGSKITGSISTIRSSGKNESRNTGSSLGRSPAAMSPVAVPCSTSYFVPKCNNDLILSVVSFKLV